MNRPVVADRSVVTIDARPTTGAAADPGPAARLRRRRRRVLAAAAALVVLGGAGAAASLVHGAQARYAANLDHFAAPVIPEAARPSPAATDTRGRTPVNLLLLGSDSRISGGDASQWTYGGQRTDAIMVVHVAADRRSAAVVSIPRDAWVPIPGHGTAKVNAAFSYGGPALMQQTVEELTGVRIDHVAILDFEGFARVTDVLGGVEICVPRTVSDMRGTFEKGCSTMDGDTALRYVRQRYGLPGGDFDRVRRQQNWVRSVMRQGRAAGLLTDPVKLDATLDALTSSLATDAGFGVPEMRELALSLRESDASAVRFLTVPVTGTGTSADGQSIVLLDRPAAAVLWAAVRGDGVEGWVETHRPDLLGSTPR